MLDSKFRTTLESGAPLLARVGENTQQVMAKYLDGGGLGIMTPMVSSAEDARTIAASTEKIIAAGKAAGTIARTSEDCAYWRERGVQVFLTSAGALLIGAAREYLEGARAAEQAR